MKKIVCACAAVVLMFLLISCKPYVVDLAALQQRIEQDGIFLDPPNTQLSEQRIATVAGLDTALFDAGGYAVFFVDKGETAEEYGLFQCKDETCAAALAAQLEARVESQRELYTILSKPASLARIDNAIVQCAGVYVAYICANDHAAARQLIETAF